MSLLKLKYKIELLAKLYKYPSLLLFVEDFTLGKNQDTKSKSKLNQSKYSMRNSKTFIGEYDALVGFDQFTAKMPIEEKEELCSFLKTIESNHLYQIYTSLSKRQLYDKLKTKTGLELIRSTFKEIVMKYKKEDITSEPQIELSDECEFYICLRQTFSLTELDAMEIFSIFKYNEFFSFNDAHFTMLVYLYMAYECQYMEDYIKLFGDDLFKVISGGEKVITLARMKELGYLVNFSEKTLNNIINEMDLGIYSDIDIGKFKEFYIKLGKKYDCTYSNTNANINANINSNTNQSGIVITNANVNSSHKQGINTTINSGQFHSREKLSLGNLGYNTTSNKFRIGKNKN